MNGISLTRRQQTLIELSRGHELHSGNPPGPRWLAHRMTVKRNGKPRPICPEAVRQMRARLVALGALFDDFRVTAAGREALSRPPKSNAGRLPAVDPRKRTITIRLTDGEHKKLKSRARGRAVGVVAREILAGAL